MSYGSYFWFHLAEICGVCWKSGCCLLLESRSHGNQRPHLFMCLPLHMSTSMPWCCSWLMSITPNQKRSTRVTHRMSTALSLNSLWISTRRAFTFLWKSTKEVSSSILVIWLTGRGCHWVVMSCLKQILKYWMDWSGPMPWTQFGGRTLLMIPHFCGSILEARLGLWGTTLVSALQHFTPRKFLWL